MDNKICYTIRATIRATIRQLAVWQARPIRHAAWPRGLGAAVLALALLVLFTPGASAMGGAYTSSGFPRADVAQTPAVTQADNAEAGLVIIATDASGPAAQAGIRRGDILLEMDGVAIDAAATLYAQLQEATPGEEVEVVIQHGDDRRTLEVTLGEVDNRAYLGVQVVDAQLETVPAVGVPVHGGARVAVTEVVTNSVTGVAPEAANVASTESVTIRIGPAEDILFFGGGLVVAEVMADAPAAEAGIQAGDLVVALAGAAVVQPDDLIGALTAYAPGDTVKLTVLKGGQVGAALVEVPVTLGAAPDDPARAYLGIRLVALPPMHETYPAPAIPVMPETAPGYGFAYPAQPPMGMPHTTDRCGAGGVTIEQHFYVTPGAAPYAVPSAVPSVGPMSFAVPSVPQSYAQSGVPAYHVFVDGTGHAHAADHATASVMAEEVVLWRTGIPAVVGMAAPHTIVLRGGDAAAGAVAEVTAQPALVPEIGPNEVMAVPATGLATTVAPTTVARQVTIQRVPAAGSQQMMPALPVPAVPATRAAGEPADETAVWY